MGENSEAKIVLLGRGSSAFSPMHMPGHCHGLVMSALPNWKSSSGGESSEL